MRTEVKTLVELRMVAWLKRIALALERANQLEEHRQDLEFAPVAYKEPRKAVFSHPSVKDWNKRWLAAHEREREEKR